MAKFFNIAGDMIVSKHDFTKSFLAKVNDQSHQRIGYFSCVTTRGGDMWVGRLHAHDGLSESGDPEEPMCVCTRGSEYWDVSKSDRERQMRLVETVIAGTTHPLRDEVLACIANERAYYA